MINHEVLQKLAEENLELKMCHFLEENDCEIGFMSEMFSFINRVYKEIPPELIQYKFRVVKFFSPIDTSEFDVIPISSIREYFSQSVTVLMIDDFRFACLDYDFSVEEQNHCEYNYYGPQNECFSIGDNRLNVGCYSDTCASSVFMMPTYKKLDEALEEYYVSHAKYSKCEILNKTWKDKEHLEFCQKPEDYMQISLAQFLKTYLRSHSVRRFPVRRELPQDASHPVDIEVTWPDMTNVVALIEIKWLGDSGTTHHRDSRANEGANQLIGYIDEAYRRESDSNFRGYHVVYDGRRKDNDPHFYRDVEIKYSENILHDMAEHFANFFAIAALKDSPYEHCIKNIIIPDQTIMLIKQYMDLTIGTMDENIFQTIGIFIKENPQYIRSLAN